MNRKHRKSSLGKYIEKASELHMQQQKEWEYSTSWYDKIIYLIYTKFYIKPKGDNDIAHVLWFDILAGLYLLQNIN